MTALQRLHVTALAFVNFSSKISNNTFKYF
nr:MAG TPA: hypothetical protein [Caudoviricetes sp.]